MSLPPVLYHYFPRPLPYGPTLALQERLHQLQLSKRRAGSHSDILLLLQHRPVYTAGRRQTEADIHHERVRLTGLGADFVTTARGGQTTYHGPGQLVGYPLLDLSRTTPTMGIRDYICRMQKSIERYLRELHGIEHYPSEHTGVFLDESTKIASIGVQVRHRLTSHGFAMNVTEEPVRWFEQVVACGLTDVKAGSIEGALGKEVGVKAAAMGMVDIYRSAFERDFAKLNTSTSGEVGEAIAELEELALKAGDWSTSPASTQ